MEIKYYPSPQKVKAAMAEDDPLLVLISFDGQEVLLGPVDDCVEHVILLKQLGHKENDLDKYFRVVLNKSGADWTFVCPAGYAQVRDKERRIERFYKDGFRVIPAALKKIGYDVELQIPKRYQRHMHLLKNGNGQSE